MGITRAEKYLHISCAKSRTIFGKTSYNKMSRFVEEIPLDYIDRTIEEKKTEERSHHRFRDYAGQKKNMVPKSYIGTPMAGGIAGLGMAGAKKSPPPLYRVGDRLHHKVFGDGEVTELHPMGGDMLLTIRFETKGEKRLMANTASKMLTKLS